MTSAFKILCVGRELPVVGSKGRLEVGAGWHLPFPLGKVENTGGGRRVCASGRRPDRIKYGERTKACGGVPVGAGELAAAAAGSLNSEGGLGWEASRLGS